MTNKPRIWILRPSAIAAKRSWNYLSRIAKNSHIGIDALVEEERKRLGLPRASFRLTYRPVFTVEVRRALEIHFFGLCTWFGGDSLENGRV
jgi:hypothetical protein